MKKPAQKFDYILRYFYGMMAISVTAAIAALVALYLVEAAESRARDRVLFFHIKSSELSQQIHRESESLLPILDSGSAYEVEFNQFSTGISQPGPDNQGTLRMMSTQVDRLHDLQARFGGEEFSATLQRITDRLEQLEQKVTSSLQPESAGDAVLMLGLALEQLKRQHDIATTNTYGSIDMIADRGLPFLGIITLLVSMTGLVTWFSVRQMRASMERQTNIENALSDSQERMHHMQKLEALGQLVGGVAHDFNNLLTAILGHASLLLDKPISDKHVQLSASQIRQAAEQAASLTRQLLAFSRAESVELQVVNLNELIREMNDMLRRLIGEHIELVTLYADDLFLVELDPGQMRQVVLNLVVNARDAMPLGGQLTIVTGNAAISVSDGGADPMGTAAVPAGRCVRLEVADTGVGMDADTCARIFEPYFTTKAKGRGTGLGLSTVHGIIKAAGGSIKASSKPGSGSRFEILLPSSDKFTATLAEKGFLRSEITGAETVLIVEDEDQIRALLENGLASLGYQVLTAPDARSGLKICRANNNKIDVIVSDVIMPKTNGADFLKGARRYQPFAVGIFMSGYTDDILKKSGTAQSNIPLITKPFEVAALAKLIRTCVDQNKTL